MNVLKDIRQAFEQRGYREMPDVDTMKRGSIWYRHESSTFDIEHVIYLSYKPNAKAYSVHVGVFNPAVRERIIAALPWMSSFVEPIYLADSFFVGRPCWHMFDAGRALNWKSIYVIPDPQDRASWGQLFESLFADFIELNFFNIRDSGGILELLFRNYAPYEWSLTNSIFRTSEIISLGRVCKIDRSILFDRFNNLEMAVSRNIYGGRSYEEVLTELFERFYQ